MGRGRSVRSDRRVYIDWVVMTQRSAPSVFRNDSKKSSARKRTPVLSPQQLCILLAWIRWRSSSSKPTMATREKRYVPRLTTSDVNRGKRHNGAIVWLGSLLIRHLSSKGRRQVDSQRLQEFRIKRFIVSMSSLSMRTPNSMVNSSEIPRLLPRTM